VPYLLDSDVVIDYLLDVPAAIELVDSLTTDRVGMSAITYMEVYEGTLGADDTALAQAKLAALVEDVRVILFGRRVAQAGASLRRRLRAQGVRVNQRANDLNVAATALAYNLTLVTRNVRDFLIQASRSFHIRNDRGRAYARPLASTRTPA
jgi:predicted nucleic acid-binding protein